MSSITILFLSILFSCSNSSSAILEKKDYDEYLNHDSSKEITLAENEILFWSQKYSANSNQYPYLSKMAVANENLFKLTGKIEYLIEAGTNLELANKMTGSQNPGLLRALSKNYISQHRFTEAKALLTKAKKIGQSLTATEKMLFDVNLEIGKNLAAKILLESMPDQNAFDYLIRRSKWEDHNGNLDQAIVYMEMALDKAVSHGNKNLIQWSHTNLADFYGHAGRISDAYQNYLAALKIAPSDAYAKKGLAWIAYSHERNTTEAKRILQYINSSYNSPDYYLLKSEIAAYESNDEDRKKYIEQYISSASNKQYGKMYNKYNIAVFTEELNQTKAAMQLAEEEIEMRPIPQSYSLLAWTYFLAGDKAMALEIINKNVLNKSSEPEILYQIAEICKGNNQHDKVQELKNELLECKYELGPVYANKIELL